MYIFVGTRVIYERAQNRTNYLKIQCIKMLQVWSNWRCVCLCLLFSFKFPFREVTRSKCKRGAAKTKQKFFVLYPFHILPWLKLWRFKMHSFKYNMAWNYSFKSMVHQNSKKSFKDKLPCLFCHLQSAHLQYCILMPIRHLVKV